MEYYRHSYISKSRAFNYSFFILRVLKERNHILVVKQTTHGIKKSVLMKLKAMMMISQLITACLQDNITYEELMVRNLSNLLKFSSCRMLWETTHLECILKFRVTVKKGLNTLLSFTCCLNSWKNCNGLFIRKARELIQHYSQFTLAKT